MVREVISLSCGQAGVQLTNTIWAQYSAEHGISASGLAQAEDILGSCETFFSNTSTNRYVPRSLSVDLEAGAIDDLKNGLYGNMFNSDFLINSAEDAANNFARGYYTVGREILELVMEKCRQLVEYSESPQGFLLAHSVGGGTGSGLGSLILESIGAEFRKKTRIGFEIYPGVTTSNAITEPYNCILATHYLRDNIDVSIPIDNESLYRNCQKQLKISRPCFSNINRIVAKLASSVTCSLRFDGEQNVDMGEWGTNLVPFPGIHFMTSSLAPIIDPLSECTTQFDCRVISAACVDSQNFFVTLPGFDSLEDEYVSMSFNYRGNVTSQQANETLGWLKEKQKVKFVDWSPTGFKIGLNAQVAALVEGDDLAFSDRQVSMVSNNVGISRLFSRITSQFDMMYAHRAYVHWYVGEGMEEGELTEAREGLGFLENDYLELQSSSLEEASEEESAETYNTF